MVINRSLAIMRGFTSSTATATTTTTATMNGKFEVWGPPIWKRGHRSSHSVGERIQVIPGFRTSAAFLSSLGANLRIADDDLLPSPANTPSLRPTYDLYHNLPPPSPLPGAVLGDDEVDRSSDVFSDSERAPSEGAAPPITKVATSDDDIVAALKLVADSVGEQRHVAARVLVLHPFSVAIFTLLISATMHFMFKPGLYGKLLMTITGLVILAVAFVRQVTLGYIFAAEDLAKMWLVDDQILVSKFGGVVIGALVLGWEKGEGRGNRRKKWGKGIVRAWAVKPKYRGNGVGSELLADAVKETAKRGGEDVIFAEDHAHSKIFLPHFFQAPLIRKEAQYKQQLEEMSTAKLGRGKR